MIFIRKKIILLLLLVLPLVISADEKRVLLTGFTIHQGEHDRFGENYNAFNYGAGFEYSFFEAYNELYFTTNALVFNDSFKNPQLAIGFGHSYRFDIDVVDVAFGLSGFVGIKKVYTDDDKSRADGNYGFTGGLGPTMNFYYKDISLNLVYVPSFKYKELKTTAFLFVYFGYKF
ncbi:MAG: hypothetical protein QM493_09070 [Sulfurovum sp.]